MADKDDTVKSWSYDARKVLMLGGDGINRVSDSNPLPSTATISGDVNVDSTSLDMSGYVGKASGTNADFTTAYLAGTTITLSGFPSDVDAFTADDIASVVQIATDGSVTATYTRDDAAMSITANVLTVSSATFTASDTFVIYTNVARPSGGGSASVDAEFKSPSDFSATFTSSTTVTLSGVPFTASSEEIVYIKVVPASGDTTTYVAGSNGVSLTISSNVITIAGAGTPFVISDAYEIGINAQQKAYDSSLDINKTIDQSPLWSRYTDPETLISAAQELDATPTDMGSEIDVRGYNYLSVWLTVDIGTSTDVTLRMIHKHTSAGAEEYREIYLGTPAANITSINLNDYQVATDADQLIKLTLPVIGTQFVQFQVSDAADGDGQIDAAYITKSWGN